MDVKTIRNSNANTVYTTRHFNPTTIRIESIITKDGSSINVSELDKNINTMSGRIAACEINDKTIFKELSDVKNVNTNQNLSIETAQNIVNEHDARISSIETQLENGITSGISTNQQKYNEQVTLTKNHLDEFIYQLLYHVMDPLITNTLTGSIKTTLLKEVTTILNQHYIYAHTNPVEGDDHSKYHIATSYNKNNDGTHNYYCNDCKKNYVENEACTYESYSNGSHKCSICSHLARHTWNDAGKCTVCNKYCEHSYVLQSDNFTNKCSNCKNVCLHGTDLGIMGFSNGVCLSCQYTCVHNQGFTNYICNVCELPCTHATYDNATGICTACNYQCPHATQSGTSTYESGVCSTCGYVHTDHNYIDGTCSICSYSHSDHSYTDGICTICKYECTHPSGTDVGLGNNTHNYVCDVCSKIVYNHPCAFENGICPYCKVECNHSDKSDIPAENNTHNYTCNICGTIIEANNPCHDWNNGKCGYCGQECSHNWSNSVCTICSKICAHPNLDSNGYCSICGYQCPHVYNNGVCTNCGYTCSHNWNNSIVCTICSYQCTHNDCSWNYDRGGYECSTCKLLLDHDHTYDNYGWCSVCNYQCSHGTDNGYGYCVDCQSCLHKNVKYTIGFYAETSHQIVCTNCEQFIDLEEHTFSNGSCSKCGYVGSV